MIDNETWTSQLRQRLARDRVPISGTIALTDRCNLRCAHCYLGPDQLRSRQQAEELTTGQVLHIIDQITTAGCLSLLLTGGDPLLRTDFPEIYRYARSKGLLVTVFCNGTLLTGEHASLFRQYPPLMVEITLYGASAATYQQVTGSAEAYRHCLRGVQLLLDHQVQVGLKTVVMTLNQHEVTQMRRMARQLGVRFRTDAAIFPSLDRDRQEPPSDNGPGPLQLRITPEQAVTQELADPDRLQEWVDVLEKPRPAPAPERLYVCGAGVTSFHIDPYGYISPCLMATQYRERLLDHDFATLWADRLVKLHETKPRQSYRCNTCEVAHTCGACPAFHYQETGFEDVESGYLCETGRLRWERVAGHARKLRGGSDATGDEAGGC